jgi:predicted nucleic acid-binding protein
VVHGLDGLLKVDIVNFDLHFRRAWQEPSAFAYLQLGLADIMHILLAQHLGCTYIASFDSDFKRVKNIIMKKLECLC